MVEEAQVRELIPRGFNDYHLTDALFMQKAQSQSIPNQDHFFGLQRGYPFDRRSTNRRLDDHHEG